jgi:hypothetical protein
MAATEQPAPRPRPRAVPAPEPVEAPIPPVNGKWPHDDPLRALTRSLEDFHAAAMALNLPPVALTWQNPEELDERPDAEVLKRLMWAETLIADMEGVRSGPATWPVAEIAAPLNPGEYLVENLIRPGTTVMLAGPPGAAKSWASRQLAMCAAAGLSHYLDRYAVPRALNVLVIDEDNGPDEEWRREESLMAHLGLERGKLVNLRRVSLEGIRLDEEPWQRWLRGVIRTHAVDLTILDPISEMHGGKEMRDDVAFRAMLAFLKRLKVDFPTHSTVVVHHTRKRDPKMPAGTSTLEDVRGQWGQTPDVVAMMVPLGDRRAKWEVHKRVPHSSLLLDQVPQGEPGEGAIRFVQDAATVPDKRSQTDGRVLACIDGGLTTVADIREQTKMANSTLYKVLGRLHDAGLITDYHDGPIERLLDREEEMA